MAAALASFLRNRHVLLCYGLMGEGLARLGLGYMDAPAEWFAAQGARPEVLWVHTADHIARNARKLSAALRDGPGGTLVVAHSKGAVEALTTLIEPEIAARCAAFIAFQAPFRGSHVADVFAGSRPLNGLAHATAHLLQSGSGDGLADLTTAAREAWMEAHAERIAALTRRLPVVSVASDFSHHLHEGHDIHLAALALWLRASVGPNDGLVSVESALLPGARHIIEQGGHMAFVRRGAGHDPAGGLERALRTALA